MCAPWSALQSPPVALGQLFSSVLLLLGAFGSFPESGFAGSPTEPCERSCFPRGAAPEGSCSPHGLHMGMWRAEEMGGGGCPPTPTRKGPFPSMYPLGVNRAIPEYHLFEQKGFLSAIADVSVSQHSRTDISQPLQGALLGDEHQPLFFCRQNPMEMGP